MATASTPDLPRVLRAAASHTRSLPVYQVVSFWFAASGERILLLDPSTRPEPVSTL